MLRLLKKRVAPTVCSWVPADFWHWLLDVDILIPNYHVVSDEKLPHVSWKYRTVAQFKADMEFFLESYTPVSLQEIIAHLEEAKPLPRRCFLPTFDDGFSEIYHVVAPILQAYGIPAAFFLTTSVMDNRELCCTAKTSLLLEALQLLGDTPGTRKSLEILTQAGIKGSDIPSQIRNLKYHQRPLLDTLAPLLDCDFSAYAALVSPYVTTAQVKKLISQGFAIGAHSVDHPRYTDLNLEDQLWQTNASINWLSKTCEYDCQAFAFPYTDEGVSPEFFQRAFSDGRLKISFGNVAMHRHFFRKNIERFTMEKTDCRAALIVAREFGVNAIRKTLRQT